MEIIQLMINPKKYYLNKIRTNGEPTSLNTTIILN